MREGESTRERAMEIYALAERLGCLTLPRAAPSGLLFVCFVGLTKADAEAW